MQVINNSFKEAGKTIGQGVATNNKILSTEDIKEIQQYINTISTYLKQYSDDINTIIKHLNDEQVVQSFFNSGLLGKNVKEKIEQLDKILTNYISLLLYDGVSGSLLSETYEFLRNQENYTSLQLHN